MAVCSSTRFPTGCPWVRTVVLVQVRSSYFGDRHNQAESRALDALGKRKTWAISEAAAINCQRDMIGIFNGAVKMLSS